MSRYLLYKIGAFIAVRLPLRLAYRLAAALAILYSLFARKDNAILTANLKAVFPDKRPPEIRSIRQGVFKNFTKYLVDFFRFPLLNKENVHRMIRIENLNYIDQALAKGKGAIILTAHIGNWELGGIAMALTGYPIGAVALPHRHKKVDDFFNQQRQKKGMIVMPLGRAARECLGFLQQNKIVALAGDRVFGSGGIRTEFFGLPARLPAGPAAFSLKCESPIIPGFVIRNPDDTFVLKFESPIEFKPGSNKDSDIAVIVAKYKTVIEKCVRKYPEQWLMFYLLGSGNPKDAGPQRLR